MMSSQNDTGANPYQVKGVRLADNYPPYRFKIQAWYDSKSGLLVLFGGGCKNDFWVWDGLGWAYLAGSSTNNAPGSYSNDSTAYPSARYASFVWISNGTAFMYGGFGCSEQTINTFPLRDLWKFEFASISYSTSVTTGAIMSTVDISTTRAITTGAVETGAITTGFFATTGSPFVPVPNSVKEC